MISRIRGTLLDCGLKGKDYFSEIMTSGGVGYRVVLTQKSYDTISQLNNGDEIELFTFLVVREESQTLFGFANQEERKLFELLITVSGIGPKTAVAVLSTYSTDDLKQIISSSDDKLLSKVSGLGGKGAQKIIIELKTKVDSIDDNGIKTGRVSNSPLVNDLGDALKALGYKGEEFARKIEYGSILVKAEPEIAVEDLIQRVLRGE